MHLLHVFGMHLKGMTCFYQSCWLPVVLVVS